MRPWRLLLSLLFILPAFSACDDDPEILLNLVPEADAGTPQSITSPTNTVTLSGTGTDRDGNVVAYLWSQVNGPAPSIIANPGSATTAVNGLIVGSYKFQLMVTDDDGATGVDTVTVIVNQGSDQTLTVQPTNNPNERMLVNIGGVDQSFSGGNEWVVAAWTVGGSPYAGRKAFKFDLSSIPSSATILSANLFLYSNTPPENGNLIDANFGTNNSLVLQRITSSWTPATATWNNQPSTTTSNEVLIPHTSQSVLDLNVNVTSLVSAMVNNNANHGFLLRLQDETFYNSRMFVSSHHASKPSKHPKLVITYR